MPLSIFAIPQVVNLVVPETSGPGPRIRMNYPVNRTDFRLIRGVTNRVEVFLRDIDRQPFRVPAGATVSMVITDLRGKDRLLLRRDLVLTNVSLSLWRLTVEPSVMDRWQDGMLRFTVIMTEVGGVETVLWTDRDYSPFGFLRLSEPPVPEPLPPQTLDPAEFLILDLFSISPVLVGAAAVGSPDSAHTLTFNAVGFAGVIIVEGTLDMQPSQDDGIWFEIGRIERPLDLPDTAIIPYTFTIPVQGVRVRFQAILGEITEIQYRN